MKNLRFDSTLSKICQNIGHLLPTFSHIRTAALIYGNRERVRESQRKQAQRTCVENMGCGGALQNLMGSLSQ